MGVAHIPVLLDEVADNLASVTGNLFVDATVGGGGHSSFILERYPGLNLVGLDVDEDNLKIAEEWLRDFGGRVTLIRGNFRNLKELLKGAGINSFDSILFDLGLSTFQISGTRGFSFNDDSFLDMRMDSREPLTAYDVVNKYNYEALKRIILEFGEEYRAARIARVITEERKRKPIATAKELANVVGMAKRRTGRVNPLRKHSRQSESRSTESSTVFGPDWQMQSTWRGRQAGSASYPFIRWRTGSLRRCSERHLC